MECNRRPPHYASPQSTTSHHGRGIRIFFLQVEVSNYGLYFTLDFSVSSIYVLYRSSVFCTLLYIHRCFFHRFIFSSITFLNFSLTTFVNKLLCFHCYLIMQKNIRNYFFFNKQGFSKQNIPKKTKTIPQIFSFIHHSRRHSCSFYVILCCVRFSTKVFHKLC